SALMSSLILGNAGASTIEFQNVSDPATKVVTAGIVTNNGTVTLKITGSGGLSVGNTYPLIGYSSFTSNGTFVLSLPAGVTATLTNDAVNSWLALNVTAVAPSAAAKFNSISVSGTNVIITATNNSGPGGTYTLLGTNNIAAPLATWPVIK